MMTPSIALNRYASENRKHDLYLNELKDKIHYGFRIGDLNFLLRSQEKIEVIENSPVCPIPNTPGWFSGMFNLRGDVFPVFDINFLITKNAVIAKWIMVFKHNGHSAGIYIDSLPSGITPDTRINNHENIPEILQGCINDIFGLGNDVWFETDFEKLFLELRSQF